MIIKTVSTIWISVLLLRMDTSRTSATNSNYSRGWSDDASLNFTELAVKYVGICEEYEVITEDGYILKLFRLPGDPRRPVLLVPGGWGSADDFLLQGALSLPVALRREGRDVWVGSARGSRHGLRHVALAAAGRAFWDFSLHEHGLYDIPALVDFVLHKTGQKRLSAIGYSIGNTVFYILGATRPEYNYKISILIALAPICYLHYSVPFQVANTFAPAVLGAAKMLNYVALNREGSITDMAIRTICANEMVAYKLCLETFAFPVFGYDSAEIVSHLPRVLFAHYPSSNSLKNLEHASQIITKKAFTKFDYGPAKNMVKYGSPSAPEYRLGSVNMRVALVWGAGDRAAGGAAVGRLAARLARPVALLALPYNHLDFLFGKSAPRVLYPHIFRFLAQYENV